jgi:soluble lytic murein transglycosylase
VIDRKALSLRIGPALLGGLAGLVAGCGPATPSPVAQPPVLVEPLASSVAIVPAVPLPPPDPAAFDPASITLVLEDPRLAAVKAEAEHEAFGKAATALAAAIASASPSPEDRAAWLFQLGHLRALGGDPTGAAKAFEESAATPWALADYARLEAAEWQVGVGAFDAALADLKAIAQDLPLASAAELVAADALLGKNDMNAAAKHFRAYLGPAGPATPHGKHPAQWATVALRFANALLNHPSHANTEEAIHVARRVAWESTGGQGAGAAAELEKKAMETLPSKRRKVLAKLSIEEQIARAHGLAQNGQPREAVIATDRLIKLPKLDKPGELACEVWILRGEALVKMKNRKPEAADAYKGAIDHCEGQPRRADALFQGGRASASAGRQLEAVERFARLEKELPGHRLADDSRLRGAHAALEANDEPRFTQMLSTIAESYPEGDVTNDGLFELALHHVAKRDWAGAVAPLTKALERTPRERAYWASGRLPYFLARAHLELGAKEQGLAELASVIRDYPATYYMGLAYARLAERDRAAADRVLAEAFSDAERAEPQGAFTVRRGPWMDEPGFVRARELLRQGEVKLARGELDRIGFAARTAPREVLWTVAFLLARQGAFLQSHQILRTPVSTSRPQNNELTDWLEHYPAGRWRAAWEIAYPRPFAPIVATEARKEGLPEAWAYAIMREESAFDPRVVSGAQAVGLMQLIVPTAKKMGERLGITPDLEMLKQPAVNIPLGCHYLMVLRGQFADNPLLAIPGYNAGAGAPKKWIEARPTDDFDLWVEHIPYEETRNYTKRVIGTMAAYELLYARDRPSEALHAPLWASPAAHNARSDADRAAAPTP